MAKIDFIPDKTQGLVESVMALHNGLDLVAIVSRGVFSTTYGSANPDKIADLFCSAGYLEDAPQGIRKGSSSLKYFFSKRCRPRGRGK